MSNQNSAYSILGLTKESTDKDIKNAYINLVKKYDPEKHTERFMVIQQAYDKLRNPKLRAREDVFSYNMLKGEYLFKDGEKSGGEEPDEVEISRARVNYHENAGDEDARNHFIALLFKRAHYHTVRRQLNDAIRDWNEVLEVDPSNIRARHNLELACANLGLSYALHGLHEEAVELWERALQLNPDNTSLVQNLALVSEKAGDPRRAGEYWGETVTRWKVLLNQDAENDYLRNCIVEALNHHGEYSEENPIAAAAGSAAMNRAPMAAPSQAEVPKPAEMRAPSPGTEEKPSSGNHSRDRIRQFISSSKPKVDEKQPAGSPLGSPVERLREIVKLKPDDFDAHYQLCSKLMEEQAWTEAEAELNALAKKHPRNTEVLNLLGWALLNMGKKDAAFNNWKRSLSIDPKNAATREHLVRAHLTMGKIFRNKGLFTQALVHFKQLLALMPRSAEVHLEIAATYDMKGDTRSAQAEYNQVLELDPKNKVARKAINDLRMKR